MNQAEPDVIVNVRPLDAIYVAFTTRQHALRRVGGCVCNRQAVRADQQWLADDEDEQMMPTISTNLLRALPRGTVLCRGGMSISTLVHLHKRPACSFAQLLAGTSR